MFTRRDAQCRPGRAGPTVTTALAVLVGAVAALVSSGGCSRPVERPNVVLVVLDTVRCDYTGCGRSESFTPNLDGLMAEGTRFTNAWATAPWTPPSHGSIFTGLLPSEHGCTARNPRLPSEVTTLAERMSDAGYETAAFHSNPWLALEMTDLTRGFEVLKEETTTEMTVFGESSQGGPENVRNSSEWLNSRDGSKPFFMFVNILEAHLPYDPPADYRREELSDLPPDAMIRTRWANEFNAGVYDPERVNWRNYRRLYAGDVHTADAYLGEILGELKSLGLYEDSVIIVTSDHGENLGDHGLVDHQFGVFETLLAVPLVVRAPGRMAIGTRDDPTMLSDIYTTVLDIAGVDQEAALTHSRSLLQRPANRDRPMIAEYSGPPDMLIDLLTEINPELDPEKLMLAHATVRVGDLRLTLASDGSVSLVDQTLSPDHRVNMAASDPAKVNTMCGLIPSIELPRGEPLQIDEKMAEWLKSLGYM
jgi:arylsulfatase A-like enzyme